MKSLQILSILTIVFFGVIFFINGIYFSIELSVGLFLTVTVFFIIQFKNKNVGWLVLYMWLIYALPFIHIPSYIGFDFNSSPTHLWGLAVNPYMMDKEIIKLTAMIGAIGGLGIAFGSLLTPRIKNFNCGDYNLTKPSRKRLMSLPIWMLWLTVGFLLTLAAAPEQTIFNLSYSESVSGPSGIKLDSAWTISYIVLTFAFCDALQSARLYRDSLKLRIILILIGIIVVFYQLLRGDRECLPWVFGLILAYFYWAPLGKRLHMSVQKLLKLLVITVSLFTISAILGAIRSISVGESLINLVTKISEILESQDAGVGTILHGTWSACLLSPLSVAGDHVTGLLATKYGKDYLDFALSVPPGFIADAIGYIRPIDSTKGPAWEMRYGLGGTHATVVPFMNFRMLGVFSIPAIWSWIVNILEKKTLLQMELQDLSFLIVLTMIMPHWLWYGEKILISCVIIFYVTAGLYRFSINTK